MSHPTRNPPSTAIHRSRRNDRKPNELPYGQRQRVAMGRAIVRNPKAFLFDELLSNLDAKLGGPVRAEIKTLSQQLKTAMVSVTHDQVEAMTLADRIVVLQSPPCSNTIRPKGSMNGPRTSSWPVSSFADHEFLSPRAAWRKK